MATEKPRSALRPAAFSPGGPAPITMTSNSSAICHASFVCPVRFPPESTRGNGILSCRDESPGIVQLSVGSITRSLWVWSNSMADTESPPSLIASTADEADLLASLRTGDEQAFARLVDSHHASMVRLAMVYVPSWAVAEEVAQEAWLAVLQGLDRFEGRSSLKTWIFRILMNRAMT